MSSLGHMYVSGVRSFGTEKPQGLKFYSPLTLIVGKNGSGKTTLIECLRYMTTGDMPPGSTKNSSFVHDPKVSGVTEVKAQIKLKFFDVNNQSVVAIRSLISHQKEKKLECRTLDGVLKRMDKAGQRLDMSAKCMDMNREMSTFLGVSKAVLNNVIFCHQEESNWPLSEPKALKVRFDELFDATKYIKALDTMKKLSLEQKTNMKFIEGELRHLQDNKEKALLLRDQLNKDELQLQKCAEDSDRLMEKIQPLEKIITEANRHREAVEKLKNEAVAKRTEKSSIEKNVVQLREGIHEFFEGDIESLRVEIMDFETNRKSMTSTLEKEKRELDDISNNEKTLSSRVNKFSTKKGKLEAEIHNNITQIEKRDKRIVDDASKFEISGFSNAPFTDAQVQRFLNTLRQKTEKTNHVLEEEKARFDEELAEIHREIVIKSTDVASKNETIRIKDETASSKESELKQIRSHLKEIDTFHARREELEKEIIAAEKELRSVQKGTNEVALKDEIASRMSEKDALDKKARSLQDELRRAQAQSGIRTELEMFTKNRTDKNEELENLRDKHSEALKKLFKGVGMEELRDAVEDYLGTKAKEIQKTRAQLETAKIAEKTKEQERDLTVQQLRSHQKELQEAEGKMMNASVGPDFEKVLQNIENDLEKLQLEKGTLDGSRDVFTTFINSLTRKDCCPLCERKFNEKVEAENLKKKLQRDIKTLPDRLAGLKEKIDQKQSRQNELLKLHPLVEIMENIENVLVPTKKSRAEELQAEIQKAKNKISELDKSLSLLVESERIVKAIQTDVGQMDSLTRELKDIDRRISKHKDALRCSSNVRSVSEIQLEIDGLQLSFDDVNEAIQQNQEQLSRFQETVQRLRSEINDLTKEKLEITDKFQKRENLKEKMASLTKEIEQCRSETEEAKRRLPNLTKQVEDLQAKEKARAAEKESKLNDFGRQRETYQASERVITELNDVIESFAKSGRSREFEDCMENLHEIETELRLLSSRREEGARRVGDTQQKLSRSDMKLRELKDCLAVKSAQIDCNKLGAELRRLESELNKLQGSDTGDCNDDILARHGEFVKELHQINGQKSVLENNVRARRKELSDRKYQEAEKAYFWKTSELICLQTANDDLKKNSMALDSAIMKHHSTKMEAVNKILRELWQKIYKHSDIDYIQIKSDVDSTGSSTDRRRVYNYSVVMRNNGVELDMRGRCSAGQKVLASILVRIALAEVFCTNCGIFALDEPTTNLDSENIESLASALVELIQERTHQKNFQLILITHDEHFVSFLLRGYPMEQHCRIEKNNRGYTIISERPTGDLDN